MVIYGVLSIFGFKANCFQWSDHYYQLSFVEVTSPWAKMSKYYKVSKILAVRSVDGRKEYRVRWSGFGSAADSCGRMLDWKQSLLLLFNPWVERGNSGSAKRAALPLDYRARYFRVHPTLILWVLERKRACSQSSQMRTSLSLPRVVSLSG